MSPEASVLTWLSSSEEQPPTLDEEIRASPKIMDYKATRPDDSTKEILAAFKEHLPWDGIQALVSFIAGADDGELMQLAYHLYTAILLPCIYLLCQDGPGRSPCYFSCVIETPLYNRAFDMCRLTSCQIQFLDFIVSICYIPSDSIPLYRHDERSTLQMNTGKVGISH